MRGRWTLGSRERFVVSVFDLEFDLSLLTVCSYRRSRRYQPLHLSSEFLLQLVITDLDHGRAPMWTTIRQIAGEKIVNELVNLDGTKLVICFDRMAANRFCYHVFSQS